MFVFTPWAPFAFGSNPTQLRCSVGVLIHPSQKKIKHPFGCLIFMADGEGFEPPVELPPQRFSRPPHSTALPTILNFQIFPPVFQTEWNMCRFSNHAQFIFWHDKCQMFFVLIFNFYFHICSHYTSTPIASLFFYASKSIMYLPVLILVIILQYNITSPDLSFFNLGYHLLI